MDTIANSSADRVRGQVKAGTEAIKDQIQAAGRTIGNEVKAMSSVASEEVAGLVNAKVDSAREGAAKALAKAASSLENRKGAQAVSSRLDHAASYLREKRVPEMSADVRRGITQNPGAWICAATAFGFLAGVFISRRSKNAD